MLALRAREQCLHVQTRFLVDQQSPGSSDVERLVVGLCHGRIVGWIARYDCFVQLARIFDRLLRRRAVTRNVRGGGRVPSDNFGRRLRYVLVVRRQEQHAHDEGERDDPESDVDALPHTAQSGAAVSPCSPPPRRPPRAYPHVALPSTSTDTSSDSRRTQTASRMPYAPSRTGTCRSACRCP